MCLALCGLENNLVGAINGIAQDNGLAHQAAVRVDILAFLAIRTLDGEVGDNLHRDSACHLARIVTAHAVGQHHQPDIGIGSDSVFVMVPYFAGIRNLSER